jgi:hypothetical protein
MAVIALVSMKGGVGKTTIALGLASAGWQRGDRVLLVDADPLGNATGVLDSRDPAAAAEQGPWQSRWGEQVRLADGSVLGSELSRLRAEHDIVIIDSPPALGEVPMSALAAADVAVIVTEPGGLRPGRCASAAGGDRRPTSLAQPSTRHPHDHPEPAALHLRRPPRLRPEPACRLRPTGPCHRGARALRRPAGPGPAGAHPRLGLPGRAWSWAASTTSSTPTWRARQDTSLRGRGPARRSA